MTDVDTSYDLETALASAEFAADPFPVYAELRGRSGWLAPSGYRVFSTYEDVLQILAARSAFTAQGPMR